MAERYYTAASGNWSTTANWDGGTTLPGASDDVYANGKTITIDQDITVLSLRTTAGTTAVAGGGFTFSTARTINATGTGILAGTTTCLTFTGTSGTTATIVANVTAGSGIAAHGLSVTSTGTVGLTGNVVGGTGSGARGVSNTSSGTITVTGNATGGSNTNAIGILNSASGTVTLTGNATGGSSSTAYGVLGGTGLTTINGDAIPATAAGANNNSAGKTTVLGGFQSVSTGVAAYGAGGGILLIDPSITVTHKYRGDSGGGTAGSERTLTTSSGGGSTVAGSRIFGGF